MNLSFITARVTNKVLFNEKGRTGPASIGVVNHRLIVDDNSTNKIICEEPLKISNDICHLKVNNDCIGVNPKGELYLKGYPMINSDIVSETDVIRLNNRRNIIIVSSSDTFEPNYAINVTYGTNDMFSKPIEYIFRNGYDNVSVKFTLLHKKNICKQYYYNYSLEYNMEPDQIVSLHPI